MDINTLLKQQQAFFNSNSTKDVSFRITQLKKIETLLKSNEALLYQAIYEDFGKSQFETYVTELALVYHELSSFIKNIRKWSKKQSVSTGLVNWPAKSYVIPEPLGNVLVIGAWNYPYQLSLLPAITALAAGNTVILKPSELPKKTSEVMANLINNNFPSDYFCVVEGGVEETTALLKHRFDKIFFTGSTAVGKIIYKAAAENLTPVTLELGGKSPTFVMADTDIKMTAKRMVWAKFLNAGQTCVAPDYVLVEKAIETEFLEALKAEISAHYSSATIEDNYLQIINAANYKRLIKLLDKDKIYYGGQTNCENRFIEPCILHQVTFDDDVMQDEIFGPILPIITFTNLDEAIKKVKERPKPLSSYIYSKNKKTINKILHEVSFGGGAVNDSLMHLSNNSHLPFGGVGLSGIGAYHGKTGFDTFTHQKSILHKSFWLEPNVKYAPYSHFKLKIIKWLMG
ncbi:aldehyde dehydrogenase [Pseudotamlana carrageenivorans]|uniref:Aldehyde dehydrogenase n=1 Tax=Pseudotamlana carrageenivorans TaxID=2069432 RepID=A0A2I7SJI6_9FLAO|nr:aldehyde dehydrogenase [Tamlana carrageenivorans]AUS06061.1 aldehyde dehydrogenase [Tamlana carrageenivorans]